MSDVWTIGDQPVSAAPAPARAAPAPAPTIPTYDASVALTRLFPGVTPTSHNRPPDHPLSIKNPDSNHIGRWDTIDVAPIEGVSYQDFLKKFKDAGYIIGENFDEASNPIPGLTTGPNWHVQILAGPDGLTDETAGGTDEWSVGEEPLPPMESQGVPDVYNEEQPEFRGMAPGARGQGEMVEYGQRFFEDTLTPLQLNSGQRAHYDDFLANVLQTGGTITPEMLKERWSGIAGLAGEDGEKIPGELYNAEELAKWMNDNRQVISASTAGKLQPAIADAPEGNFGAFEEEEDDSWLTRQAKAISRSVVQGAQYTAPGWLGANLAYLQGNGFDQLKELYPDASDEDLNELYWEVINGLQGNLRDAHDENLQDDAMAPWLFGQLLSGMADPLNLVPLGKAASTLKDLGKQVIAGGALSAGGDAVWQVGDIARGVETEFNPLQVAAAAGIGGVATGVLGGLQMGGRGAPEADIDIAPPAAGQMAPEAPGPLPGLGQQAPVEPFTPQAPDNTPPGLLREDLRASTTLRDPAFLAQRGTADPALRAEAPEVAPEAPVGRQATTPGSYTVDEVSQHVDTLTKDWKYRPDFEIVNSLEEVADQNQVQGLLDIDSPESPTIGFLGDDGKVRLIAGRITSPELLRRVLFHESLGHFGLTARYWKGLDTILDGALKTNPKFRQAADEWLTANPDTYADLPEDQQILRAAEEILAEDSEAGVISLTLRQKLRHHVRNALRWIRKDGTFLDYDDADIDAILAEAHRAVVKGKKVSPGAAEVITYFRPMKAYQGGAVRHDQFRDEFLGSGEGAHVYGHGHYFAENLATGRYYRQAISRMNPERTVDGPMGFARGSRTPTPLSQLIEDELPDLHPHIKEKMLEASNAPDRTRAIYKALDDILLWAGKEEPTDFVARRALGKQAQEARRFLMNEALPSKGYLYEVELPDDTGSNYIDLDMKWRDAPRDVQQAIETAGIRVSDLPDVVQGDSLNQIINIYGQEQVMGELLDAIRQGGNNALEGVTSSQIALEAKKAISRRLADRGFVGSKYLDQGSRPGKKGTRNRVIFRDSDIQINERYKGSTEEPIGPSDQKTPRPMQMNPTREARQEVGRRTGLDGMAAVNRIRQERNGRPLTPSEQAIRRANTMTSESSLSELSAAFDDLDQYRSGHGHRTEAQVEALQNRLQYYMYNRPAPDYVPPPAPGSVVVRPMRVGPTSFSTPEDAVTFRKAQAMDYSGRTAAEIYAATKWWRDADGGWRRHMSDQDAPTAGWDIPPADVLRTPRDSTEDFWDYEPERVEEAAQANVAAAVLREVADDPTVAPSLEHFWDSMVRGKFPDIQQNTILNAGLRRYIPETSTMAPSDVLRELYVQAASTPNPQSISLDEVLESVSQEAVNLDRQAWTPTARPMIGSDGPRGRGRVQGASRREVNRKNNPALGKYWSSKDIEGIMNDNAPTYQKQEWDEWVEAANGIRRLSHGKIEERLRAVPEYAATLLAARHWLVGSANRIKDMSMLVDTPAWTPELDAQMQMEIARNVSMQEALAGAAGNGARAINSFRIMVGTSQGTNKALVRAMQDGPKGGVEMLNEETRKELARIIRETEDVETAQRYVKDSLDPKKADYLTSLWYAQVLSRPSTLFNNLVGTGEAFIGDTAKDLLQATIGLGQRAAGAPIENVATFREAAARLWGRQVGFKQAFANLNALEAWKRGQPISGRATEGESLPWSALFDKKYDNADAAASKAIWKILGLASRGAEFAPRTMAAIDEVFRSMAIQSELYGQAAEAAVKQGHRGQAFIDSVTEGVKNPTPEQIKMAIDKAQRVTFRDAPSPAGKAIESILGRSAKDSEIGRAGKALLRTGLAPFIITPDSILRTAIRHVPGLGFMDRYNRADWKSGPKGKARVAARMSFGLGVLGVCEEVYQQGVLHTALENDYRERDSIELGAFPGATPESENDLMGLGNLGPFTLMCTMYATLRDGYDRGKMDGKDFATNMAHMSFLAASQALSNTWTEQPVGIVGAAEEVRGGEGATGVNNYWAGQAAALLAPGVLSSFNQAFIDPTYRSTDADATPDAIRNRIASGWPGFSQDLPAQSDTAGNELQRPGADGLGPAIAQFLLGNRILRRPDDPASRAIQQQAKDTKEDPIGRANNTISMDGDEYKLDREERARYAATAGAYINDDLAEMLASGEWNMLTPAERKKALSEVRSDARMRARAYEFWNNPDWRGNTQ